MIIVRASGAPLRQTEKPERKFLMTESRNPASEDHCFGCVYFPPNLPPSAYSEADWTMLQARSCAFEHTPGTDDCLASRKTSCSLVDLAETRRAITGSHE